MRIILVDPNIKSNVGHYMAYANSIATATRDLSYEFIALTHNDIISSAHIDNRAKILPTFKNDIWHNSTESDYYSDENIKKLNDAFYIDALETLEQLKLSEGDILFYPTLTAGQLDGISRIVEYYSNKRIEQSILFRYPLHFYASNLSMVAFERLEFLSASENVTLSSDSHLIAYSLGTLINLPVRVFPIPHTHVSNSSLDDKKSPNNKNIHCVSLGNARGEKGIFEIAQAINIISKSKFSDEFRFTIQINDPSEDALEAIDLLYKIGSKNITLLSEPLDELGYSSLLHSADVVLTPYDKLVYKERTSGVFLEAAALGKITIVTNNTWMSALAREYSTGIIIERTEPEKIAEALFEVSTNFKKILLNAIDASKKINAIHNPNNFLLHLLSRKCLPAVPVSRRKVGIIFPWGDVSSKTGASTRLNLLARYLVNNNFHVKILYNGYEAFSVDNYIDYEPFNLSERGMARLRNRLKASKVVKSEEIITVISLFVIPSFSPDFKKKVYNLALWADLLFLEYAFFGNIVYDISTKLNKPCLLNTHDLLSEKYKGIDPLYSIIKKREFKNIALFKNIFVASQREKFICEDNGITPILMPHVTNTDDIYIYNDIDLYNIVHNILCIPKNVDNIILFIGSNYLPNKEAASKIKEIAQNSSNIPGLKNSIFLVAGGCFPKERTEHFISLGIIPNAMLQAVYQASKIILIPLTDGTGMSIKSVEALARGKCVISSTVGMRGVNVRDGIDCIIEDSIDKYLDIIEDLLAKEDRIDEISINAELIGKRYDYREVFSQYNTFLDLPIAEYNPKPLSNVSYQEFLPLLSDGGMPEGFMWLMHKLSETGADVGVLDDIKKGLSFHGFSLDQLSDDLLKINNKFTQDYMQNRNTDSDLIQRYFHNLYQSRNLPLERAAAENKLLDLILDLYLSGKIHEANSLYIASKNLIGNFGRVDALHLEGLIKETLGFPRKHVQGLFEAAYAAGYNESRSLYHIGRIMILQGNKSGLDCLRKVTEKQDEMSSYALAIINQKHNYYILAKVSNFIHEIIFGLSSRRK